MTSTSSQGGLAELASLFSPQNRVNPYPGYAQLQKSQPIWQPLEKLFVITKHRDCSTVLRDTRFGHLESEELLAMRHGEGAASSLSPEKMPQRSFLALNPPDHTRLRRLVSRAFTPSRVEQLAPRIQEIASELLTEMLSSSKTIDLVGQYAAPIPVIVISELLGIPTSDHELLVAWSHALAQSLDPDFLLPEGVRIAQLRAREEFGEYLREMIAFRRKSPSNDLLSALVQVQDEDDVLSEEELIATCILILIAGHETTTSLIGTGTWAIINHPDQIPVLEANPELVPNAVEELLRFESPVQFTFRNALENGEVSETKIPKGSFILLLIGAANRDPDFHADPNTLDISREPTRHLAFGQGIHFCLGAPLARLEAQIALKALLPHLSKFKIAKEPTWKENAVLRGIKHLPLLYC